MSIQQIKQTTIKSNKNDLMTSKEKQQISYLHRSQKRENIEQNKTI